MNAINRSCLRSEVEQQLKAFGYTFSKLGELTGINPGHISAIMNGNPPRPMTISQLDVLAAVFGQVPGWLYELYPEECFLDGRVSRPRVVPYLIRCTEMNRQDCIELVVSKMLDNPKNVTLLFSVAEQLFLSGKQQESMAFYRIIISNEKDTYSEHFVMSHYRLFRASLGPDAEKNLAAVIRFEPYRNRLPEDYQLDALLKLANECFALHKWHDVEKYADELRLLATAVYEDQLRKRKRFKRSEPLRTERHLVVYYGQGYLMKSEALEKQGRYEESKEYISGYADLTWFEFLDETDEAELRKFQQWATANLYSLNLLAGNAETLPAYIRFLCEHPNELLTGLTTIMESANKFGFAVEGILKQFSIEISHLGDYHDSINSERLFRFKYELAVYLFRNHQYTRGIAETLHCLTLSIIIKNDKDFIRCVLLFEAYRFYATEQQKLKYKRILEEVQQHEKIITCTSSDFRIV